MCDNLSLSAGGWLPVQNFAQSGSTHAAQVYILCMVEEMII